MLIKNSIWVLEYFCSFTIEDFFPKIIFKARPVKIDLENPKQTSVVDWLESCDFGILVLQSIETCGIYIPRWKWPACLLAFYQGNSSPFFLQLCNSSPDPFAPSSVSISRSGTDSWGGGIKRKSATHNLNRIPPKKTEKKKDFSLNRGSRESVGNKGKKNRPKKMKDEEEQWGGNEGNVYGRGYVNQWQAS